MLTRFIHFAIYTDIKLLCCIPETSTMLYINCTSIKNIFNKNPKNYSYPEETHKLGRNKGLIHVKKGREER